jgi:trigger factor
MPEVDDEFAKSLGLKSKEELIDNLKYNIEHEKQHREQEAKDLEMMNLLIDKSKFGEIPDVLVTTESRKMIDELKENVARQGMVYEDYLEHLKKKESDLLLDFAADAIKRVKTTLIIRAVAQKENMLATDAEIEFERQQALQQYQMNPQFAAQLSQIEENIKSEGAKNHFANIITTRKVVNLLRKAMIPGYTEHHC